MIELFAYVLLAMALVIVFGCFYVAWALLADLISGWRETWRRGRFPRQFGMGTLFALTAVFAITSFLLQGNRIEGAAQMIALFFISLAWAAAIVYAFGCIWSDDRRETEPNRLTRRQRVASGVEEDRGKDLFGEPRAAGDSGIELERWLSLQGSNGSTGQTHATRSSTKSVRSHFRVQLTDDPKGMKPSGFGRF